MSLALQNVIQAPVGDSVMGVHVFGPNSTQLIKAVIVLMFPRSGMDGFPQRIAHELAESGFVIFVPDITHRAPGDGPIRDRKRLLTDDGVIEDIGAVLSLVEKSASRDKPRFIMGHCMGGRNALLGASVYDFAGVVTLYGGEMFDAWGGSTTPFMRLQNIKNVGHAFQQNAARSPEERQAADDSTRKVIGFLLEQCAKQFEISRGGSTGLASNVGIE